MPSDQEYPNNIKVLTETSDDEQEELMKLIKAQNEKKIDNEVIDLFSKNRKRDQSLKGIMERKSPSKE
jgi:predicted GTPase